MFECLQVEPGDPILQLDHALATDRRRDKIDMCIGAYRAEDGRTPIIGAVREIEDELANESTPRSYSAPLGSDDFRYYIAKLVLGQVARSVTNRAVVAQTIGGCGALRIGAELLSLAGSNADTYVGSPHWQTYDFLFRSASRRLVTFPYVDLARHAIHVSAMMSAALHMPKRSVIILQPSCHNPSGLNLTDAEWDQLLSIVQKRELVPFFDLAYQGLGDGLDSDAKQVRLFIDRLPNALIAVSCSKNFGLYAERTGALIVVTESAKQAIKVQANIGTIVQGAYAMPPSRGAQVVSRILSRPASHDRWSLELSHMRERLSQLRADFELLQRQFSHVSDCSWISASRGLFLQLDLSRESVAFLRNDCGIYVLENGRINISSLNSFNRDHFCQSLMQVRDNIPQPTSSSMQS
jgi:aspartate/tyrosine/aromatic aminotransferase